VILSPQLIINDTENRLLEDLFALEKQCSQWRVAVLHGSEMWPAHRGILRMRESHMVLAELIQRTNATVYFCSDADIVFLYPATTTNMRELLTANVHELLPFFEMRQTALDDLLTFHHLAEYYDALVERVRAKKMLQITNDHYSLAIEKNRAEIEAKRSYAWDAELFSQAARSRRSRKEKLAAIIEDDATLRQLARGVLSAYYNIVPSADGHEGLEMYNHCAPDLVFLDIDIPYIDGLRVLQTIVDGDPDAAVIMVTGHNSFDMIQQARKIGAKGFVTKPFTTATLLQHARQAMAIRS